MNVTIPEALHICPGCERLCEGLEYCASCRQQIASIGDFHAARAAQFYGALRRQTGVMPESRKLSQAQRDALRRFVRAGIIAVGIAFWLLVAVDVFSRWGR